MTTGIEGVEYSVWLMFRRPRHSFRGLRLAVDADKSIALQKALARIDEEPELASIPGTLMTERVSKRVCTIVEWRDVKSVRRGQNG